MFEGLRHAATHRWHDPGLLARLQRAREPWLELSRRIVHAALHRFLPNPLRTLIEIGAGDGPLRDWLPDSYAALAIATEPSATFLAAFQQRHPGVKVLHAEAVNLPFPDASASAILGLCVLDALPDLEAARDEFHRVLEPGGVILHVLDLSTNPDAAFAELIAGGEIPLPNFAREPGLFEELVHTRRPVLPITDEFDEVLAADWRPLAKTLAFLRSARHPLLEHLGPYGQLLEPGTLDPSLLGQAYMHARADSERRRHVSHALLTLARFAEERGEPLRLRGFSLRTHLRERLTRVFSAANGFTVEFAGPVLASERSPTGRHILRHAGMTITRHTALPTPGTPVESLEGTWPEIHAIRRATTIELFVARRTGP